MNMSFELRPARREELAFVMQMYNDDYETALKNVNKSDYSRGSYYRNISGQIWNESNNYHLCLDSSMGINLAVEQICTLYSFKNKNIK